MPRISSIVGLLAVFAVSPRMAQEVYEIPFALELLQSPVVLDLDDASLEIVQDPDSVPMLRAFGPAERNPSDTALVVASEGGELVVRRAASDAESRLPRLRLELVVGLEQRLQVVGSDLEVVVEGLPLKATGEGDDDEDDEIDPDEDNETDGEDDDEEEGDDEADKKGEESEEGDIQDQPVEAASPHLLILDVAASSVNLIDVVSPGVTASESFVRAVGTRGQLTLVLEGGTAEVEGHQGAATITADRNELVLIDSLGRVTPALTGGSLNARGGVGPLQGRFDDALLRVEGWRGPIVVEGSGARVEARALSSVRLEVRGEGHDIAVEDLQGVLLTDLVGSSLEAEQLKGQAAITARDGSEIVIDGMDGRPTLILEESSARVTNLAGALKTEISGGRLEVSGALIFEVVAAEAEIVADRIQRLPKAEVTDSQLDLDLLELLENPVLTLDGITEARVRLKMPCSVKLGEAALLGSGADVTGCDLHSQTFRRTNYERRGVDGNRRVLLNATLGEDSTLEVEGVP